MSTEFRHTLISNLFWLVASFLIATVVWYIATIEANPVSQKRFLRIPIQIEVDDGLIITNSPPSTALVYILAQQTILDLLTEDDIVVRVDLSGLTTGSYTVPLLVETSRPARADTQPAQITVQIQQVSAQQKPVQIDVVGLSPNYIFSNLTPDVLQAEVSGAPEDVSEVAQVHAELNLSDIRAGTTVERTVSLVPINAEGEPVDGVTVSPRTSSVSVNVAQRDDVRIVSVRPSILFDTLPEDFDFRNVDYEPRTVIINGPPEALALLGDVVDTEPISLADRTSSFTVEVPLILPSDQGLLVLSESGTVRVQVFISEQTGSLAIENVPITLIGVSSGVSAVVNPTVISVVLNAPLSTLDTITPNQVQAIIDVNGISQGSFEVVPQITIAQGQVTVAPANITLLPSRVDLVVSASTSESTETLPEPVPSPAGE